MLSYGQTSVTVKGTVTDAANNGPLSNVSIRSAKHGRSLAVTETNGSYTVTATSDDALIFTYTGYQTARINLAGRTSYVINVKLNLAENMIEETVVQGFSRRSRQTLTGSSISISGKDLQDNPVSNIAELLQGKVAGLNVQMNNGTPGTRGTVLLRGLSNLETVGSGVDTYLVPTSPLYIIDGVRVDDNTNFEYGYGGAGTGISPLSLIPPEDIEEVQILKDAASTSLYGTRGAYGVILIRTKRGSSEVPRITYTTNQFLSVPPRLRDVLGGQRERMSRINQAYNYADSYWKGRDDVNMHQILTDSLNPYFNNSTDWQGIFYTARYNQSHNISASGGDDRFNYKINGNYYQENGIVQNTGFNRYTLDMNTQYRPNDRLRLFASMSGKIGDQKLGGGTSVSQGGVASAATASSLLPSPSQGFVTSDLIASLDGRNDNRSTNLIGMLELEFDIFHNFRAKNTFSYNYSTDRTDTYKPAVANNNISTFYNYDSQTNSLNNMFFVSYLKEVGKHVFNTYLFSELDMKDNMAKAYLKSGFANDQLEGPFGLSTSKGGIISLSDYRSAGFGASFSYNYDLKYVIDLAYRIDKTSTTGAEKPWVKNPAISGRWNIERENFMEGLRDDGYINNLAVRASWGRNIFPTGSVFDAFGKYIYSGYFNNSPTIGFDWNTMPNANLQPSTSTSMSFALEGDFFDNKFNTIQEVYYKQVTNQLKDIPLADINGFNSQRSNDFAHVTYGYEFTFGYRPFDRGSDWSWRIELNGAINNEVLTLLPYSSRLDMDWDTKDNTYHKALILGRNTYSHVLYDYRGVFSTDADVPVNPRTGERLKMIDGNTVYYFEAGDPYWTDINGDYIIDRSDLVYVGSSQPKVTGGFNSFLSYKSWSLNMMFSYVRGRDIINQVLATQLNSYFDPFMTDQARNGRSNAALLPLDRYDFWTQEGDIARYPNPFNYQRQIGMKPFRANQTLFMEDGSYLKFNTATLRYTIPREWIQRYKLNTLNIYGTINNIYTFSNYSGLNPEGVSDAGYDRSDGYPNRRSFTLGVSAQF
jgi:TonB-linked SusC/RagA family outer membrane protein